MDNLDKKLGALDAKVRARQKAVMAALEKFMPDLPVTGIKAAFGAQILSLRSPDIDYGPEQPRGIIPTDPWVTPFSSGNKRDRTDQAGGVPVVVAVMSPQKRKFLNRRRNPRKHIPLSRVGTAGKLEE
jgi:hypothetical protein